MSIPDEDSPEFGKCLVAGGEWTVNRFFTFLRSNLRLASRKWPPLRMALTDARRPSQSENKRLKWEFRCASCSLWFPRTEVQVDHIRECGSLRRYADLEPFTPADFPAELDYCAGY